MALPKLHRKSYIYKIAPSCRTNVTNFLLLVSMAIGLVFVAHIYFFLHHVAILDQLTTHNKQFLRSPSSPTMPLIRASTYGEFLSVRTPNNFQPTINMPSVGYGTCCRHSAKGDDIYKSTKIYLEMGGRLIDTAMAYKNHKEIGQAIRDSGVDRSDIWITSKIAVGHVHGRDQTLEAVQSILQELGSTYLDLCLIHSPKLGKEKTIEIWQGLIDASETGLVRSIGVSNMNQQEIIELNVATGVLPAVNQIQYHPWTPQQWKDLVQWQAKNEIVTIAYTSLGGSRFHHKQHSSSESSDFSSIPILSELAKKYHATEAQVLLRWALSHPQVAVIPGATSKEHILENLNIPYFLLYPHEMERLEQDMDAPQGWWDEHRGPIKFPNEEAEAAWTGDHLISDHAITTY